MYNTVIPKSDQEIVLQFDLGAFTDYPRAGIVTVLDCDGQLIAEGRSYYGAWHNAAEVVRLRQFFPNPLPTPSPNRTALWVWLALVALLLTSVLMVGAFRYLVLLATHNPWAFGFLIAMSTVAILAVTHGAHKVAQ